MTRPFTALKPFTAVQAIRSKSARPTSGFTSTAAFRAIENTLPQMDASILQIIRGNSGLTRVEIAERSGRRLSSVCGAANRLLKTGLVIVVGTKRDPQSRREVETLAAR